MIILFYNNKNNSNKHNDIKHTHNMHGNIDHNKNDKVTIFLPPTDPKLPAFDAENSVS